MTGPGIPVLTYHSQNISGNAYGINDHISLKRDLELIAENGLRVQPLAEVIDALYHGGDRTVLERAVCLTFDDGTLFDVADLDHPEHGWQKGMRSILAEFAAARPDLDWRPHATAFVIASPEVREVLETSELAGKPWLGEDWWAAAEADELMSIGNHSWDHRHPSVIPPEAGGGDFASVADAAACREQVVIAAEYIAERIGRWPSMFAYPFGHASEYIRNDYFPNRIDEHRTRAAFSTEAGYLEAGLNPWYLPRFICGYHWRDESSLVAILEGRPSRSLS